MTERDGIVTKVVKTVVYQNR